MSTEDNKALVRGLIDEVYNNGNTAAIPDFLRPGTLLAGHVEGMIKAFTRTFPDLHYTVKDIVAEGDTVAVYTEWRGTQTGPSPSGAPPTGKQVVSDAFWFFKIRDGKILTMSAGTDRLAIMEQLGVAPAPRQPAA